MYHRNHPPTRMFFLAAIRRHSKTSEDSRRRVQAASIQLENNYNILLNTHIYIYMSVNIVYDVTIVVACMRFVDIIALHCSARRAETCEYAMMKPIVCHDEAKRARLNRRKCR